MKYKPEQGEYSPYYNNYIGLVGDDVIATLTNQAALTSDFFSQIPANRADYAYSENKWTIKEVLGHMIDVERIMTYRALRFSRNDPRDLAGFNENYYVANSRFKERTLEDLAAEYQALREANLFLFRSFNQKDLLRIGVANGTEVSVRALLYIIAGHELHHLQIIKERYLA